MGVRQDEYFQTGHRHIGALRERNPDLTMHIAPADAAALSLNEGDWVDVETRHGKVRLRSAIRDEIPAGVIRVQHGCWLPERPEGDGTLSGAWLHADAQICSDDPDFLDRELGIPHLKGIACRVRLAP